jgi:hypothetical protein
MSISVFKNGDNPRDLDPFETTFKRLIHELAADKPWRAEGEPPATTPTDGSPQGQPPQ